MARPILFPAVTDDALSDDHIWTGINTFDVPFGYAVWLHNQFVSSLHAIVGGADNMRLLYTPQTGDATTATTEDKNSRTVTFEATVVGRLTPLGSGFSVDFNGTSNESEAPDAVNLTFGDGANDEPMSIVALIKPDVNDAILQIASKEDSGTAQEWSLFLTNAGLLRCEFTDESEGSRIGRSYSVAIGTDRVFVAGTYDGSGAAAGIGVWQDAVEVSDTDVSSGAYTAMENTAAKTYIGSRFLTAERFFDGGIELVMVVATQLTADQLWAIKALVNAYFGLAL